MSMGMHGWLCALQNGWRTELRQSQVMKNFRQIRAEHSQIDDI